MIALAALAGCGGKAPAGGVAVELAGVTLADECGTGARPPKPPNTVAERVQRDMDKPAASMAKCAGPNCGGSYAPQACEQTSMQLSLRSAVGTPTTIHVKQVELLDKDGKVLEILTATSPSRWDDRGVYGSWDETVAANQTLAVSYTLSSPHWDRVAESRWKAHTKAFALRVTITAGDAEQTVDKQSIQPVMLEPPVAT
jgi:hypothetical protein